MLNDFENYCRLHLGVSTSQLDHWKTMQNSLYNARGGMVTSSITPNIVEERKLNVAMMDVFWRLMMDRIIWCAGPVNDMMAITVQAQLLFLSDQDPKKTITMHVDSPGGSVKSGLSMIDSMEYCKAPIQTINTGMAASMGSVILGAGRKGMRSSLRHSRTMLHQSSGGAGGNIQDARISFNEWEKINKELFVLLGDYCGKSWEEVANDASRDLWLSADEALNYGIIDEVIRPEKK